MKYLALLTLMVSYHSNAQDCGFEGNKWRGQRTFTEACNANRENLQCELNVQTDEAIHKQMETCHCLMAQSDFIQDHNKLIQYRSGRNVAGMNTDISVYQRRRIVRERMQAMCEPFKAVEVSINDSTSSLDNRKYYAIYTYSDTQETCIPTRTRSNYAAVGEKFNFPGAYNFTAGFSNLLQLGALHLGYNGPLNVAYVNDEDARRGHLNCSGTYSQMIELANSRDQSDEERVDGRNESSNGSGNGSPSRRERALQD